MSLVNVGLEDGGGPGAFAVANRRNDVPDGGE
jgi:hypothetical protein